MSVRNCVKLQSSAMAYFDVSAECFFVSISLCIESHGPRVTRALLANLSGGGLPWWGDGRTRATLFESTLLAEALPTSHCARGRLIRFPPGEVVTALGRFAAVAGVAILLGRFEVPSVVSDRLTAAPLASSFRAFWGAWPLSSPPFLPPSATRSGP